ncbi:heterokaryon incompatibility protein-domain-containing protein [Pisolithus croceorrhizus]|nr:heterokaryon incompatibility protein-domain-containing protein [Pisolithus croceorrhizus]
MRVINVNAFLERERQFQKLWGKPNLEVFEYHDDTNKDYCILSHRWGHEVCCREMVELANMGNRREIRKRDGYQKILRACERTKDDGFRWLWVDTCCIDDRSSSEVSEAINSMFHWYKNSQRCYAYLHDTTLFPAKADNDNFKAFNGWPEWFSRGWTLQELIAPKDLQFLNKDRKYIGDKQSLASVLEKITRVPSSVLRDGLSSYHPSAAQVMSWAADRRTTRTEDRAYSLMGLLDVNTPMLYGERKKAFQRLQLEVIRTSNDQTIFAWDPEGKTRRGSSVLADDPELFKDCHDVVQIQPKEFNSEMLSVWSSSLTAATNTMPTIPNDQGLHVFTIANAGIQIWLPVVPYYGCPSVFQAALACRKGNSMMPITIDLASFGSNHYRYVGAIGKPQPLPEYQQLYLACRDDARHDFTFEVDDSMISGFTRCSTFPLIKDVVSSNNRFVLTLSTTNPLVIVVYTDNSNGCFAVAFGYCFGQEWVHVVQPMLSGWLKHTSAERMNRASLSIGISRNLSGLQMLSVAPGEGKAAANGRLEPPLTNPRLVTPLYNAANPSVHFSCNTPTAARREFNKLRASFNAICRKDCKEVEIQPIIEVFGVRYLKDLEYLWPNETPGTLRKPVARQRISGHGSSQSTSNSEHSWFGGPCTLSCSDEWFIEDITSELLNVNGLWNTFLRYYLSRKGEENEKWNDQLALRSARHISRMVKDINTLEQDRRKAGDDGEQRALEEDILGKVVDSMLCNEMKAAHRLGDGHTETTTRRVRKVAKVLRDILVDVPDDGQAHFRRILADAKAGMSKHKMYLEARDGTVFWHDSPRLLN